MEQASEDLRYPIGKFIPAAQYTREDLISCINVISVFPEQLRKEVAHLSEQQLNTCYRQGGWTLRQVVFHCCDSHMNALIRTKLALTENNPQIKPYNEALFAERSDYKLPVMHGLDLLAAIHIQWSALLNSVSLQEFERTYFHPEHNKSFSLSEVIALYAWHCNHHLAHITRTKERFCWK